MRAVQVEESWSMDSVRVVDRPEPQAGPGQVRLAMRAFALNYRDLLVPQKGYGARMKSLPLVLLSDGVGVVDQVGPGVTSWSVGERACPLFFQSWPGGEPSAEHMLHSLGSEVDGVLADHVVLAASGVAAPPAHLDDREAATLPTAALTAWRALVTEGRVRPGDTVLVQGTGGVSLFALQFARLAGARVIVTSSSDDKLARARALGADETINYVSTPEWGRRARELAGGAGVDHVVEVGGESTLLQSLRAVRPGGTLSLIGVLGGSNLGVPLGQVVTRHVRLQGITVGSREDFTAMCRAIAQHRLRPVLDRAFPMAEWRAAFDHLRAGKHFGKVILDA